MRGVACRGKAVPASPGASCLGKGGAGLSWARRERIVPYAFLGPTLAALAVVFFFPMLEAFRMSLYEIGMAAGAQRFVGLRQYERVLTSPYFGKILVTSVVYTVGNVVFVWSIGLATALMLHRPFPGRAVARAMVILPWAIPYVAAALIWGWMFDYEFGVLNYALTTLGVFKQKVNFLTACQPALASLTGVSIWKLFPLGTVMFLAALQTIPEDHYQAARVDGAGRVQCFRYVTLPGVRNVSVFLTLLITIWSFGRSFTVIFLLTEGGPAGCSETVVIRTYLEAFKFFHPGTAAALGVLVLLISLAFSLCYLWIMYRTEAPR
jgi:multiple sugar transport system permease protein